MWQYITLMKRIYLIDCPGVVPPNPNDSEEDILLRGAVRVENVEAPDQYIDAVLRRTKPQYIERTYGVRGWSSSTEFLEMMARKSGRLLKGGEADVAGVARMVLHDFLRGKLPWFTPPPLLPGQEAGKEGVGIEGREGRLGEMGRKRKREGSEQDIGDDAVLQGVTNDDSDSAALQDESKDEEENGLSSSEGEDTGSPNGGGARTSMINYG